MKVVMPRVTPETTFMDPVLQATSVDPQNASRFRPESRQADAPGLLLGNFGFEPARTPFT